MHLFHLLILAGFLIGFVGSIWGLILAFRTSVWWGLAFLFLPFAWLIFMLGHFRETARAMVLIFVGTGLLVGGFLLSPHTARAAFAQNTGGMQHGVVSGFTTEVRSQQLPPTPEQPKADSAAAREAKINECQAQADRRCAELTQKRATINPDDKAAVAAFNAEVIQYNALLEQIKTMRAESKAP